MSSWAKSVSFNDTVVSQMTTAATTAAPTTAAPTNTPATTAPPSYPANPGFGGGGVVFPLPVAPSLLLDGDISALNPVTLPPTTTPAPTLAPIPELPTQEPEEEKPSWTWTKIGFLVFIALVVLGAIWYFFIRKSASGKNGSNGSSGNTKAGVNVNNLNGSNSNNLNNVNNLNNMNYNNSSLNDYNNSNAWANNSLTKAKK